MENKRRELAPGVMLNTLTDPQRKDACLSVCLLSQLERDTAAMSALIPYILCRGTTMRMNAQALSQALGHAAVSPLVRCVGEIQCVGLRALLPEAGELESVAAAMCEMLLSPTTKGGLFLPAGVDAEKERAAERLEARKANFAAYALLRCAEEACCYENYSVGAFGKAEDYEDIYYRKLTMHFRALLQQSPMEIVYIGPESEKAVARLLRGCLAGLPRGEMNFDIGTDVRMNSVEEEPRRVEETVEGAGAAAAVCWRLGEIMEDPDPAVLCVLAKLMGAELDLHKGLLTLARACGEAEIETTLAELRGSMERIAAGDFTDEEFLRARSAAQTALFSLSLEELEEFTLGQELSGYLLSSAELSETCSFVEREAVTEAAAQTECDLCYSLIGEEPDETEA